jgi:hypothetical protein
MMNTANKYPENVAKLMCWGMMPPPPKKKQKLTANKNGEMFAIIQFTILVLFTH